MLKQLLQYRLKALSQKIIRRYQPRIIGITGSIGKTSAKEAIALVLSDKFSVRSSQKNYNNEFGLPLTIIGAEAGGRSIRSWLKVFNQAEQLLKVKDPTYPEVLVLEMGVDRPGDMEYLCSIVTPEVGVETAVSYAHLEFFGSIANIKKEKQVLIEHVDNKGAAILNFDNEYTKDMVQASKARIISYSINDEDAALKAQDIAYNFTKGDYSLSGLNFKLNYQGSIVPVFMKNVLSETAIYASLAGAAVGLHFGLNLIDIAQSLKDFVMPKGRMNLLAGINYSFIIDDTYNSSPEACLSALGILKTMKIGPEGHKYALLGDMLEIGSYTEEGHQLIGRRAAEAADDIIAVGRQAATIAAGALAVNFPKDNIFTFTNAIEAGKFLAARIKSGDVVLAKGSQGIRLETAVKLLMAEPERAKELLVRQDGNWQE
jgi:UDP-N-acetylmuramoyl-tripeptide--D-alanyl-D-alanine ligase